MLALLLLLLGAWRFSGTGGKTLLVQREAASDAAIPLTAADATARTTTPAINVAG